MTAPYDSTAETLLHIRKVQANLGLMARALLLRGEVHDDSKLGPEEKPLFDEYTPKLSATTYGSAEYKEHLKGLKPAKDHHDSVNSHHPEHYKLWHCPFCERNLQESDTWVSDGSTTDEDGNPTRFCLRCTGGHGIYEFTVTEKDRVHSLEGFDLLDLVEMLCDWKAATERHADGDIMKSLEINEGRFHISPQVMSILRNTVNRLGWAKPRP